MIAGGAMLYLRSRGGATVTDPHLYCAPELLAKDLSGSTICITGGSSGFGKMVAEQLVSQGGHVVIAVRNMQAGESVAAELTAKGPGTCVAMQLDLASLDSVRRFAAAYKAAYSRLDIHIENAAVCCVEPGELTAEGFEPHLGVNHYGHFLLRQLLLPTLQV